MRLSRAGRYAVAALAYLAAAGPGRAYASHAIARAQGIPEKFLLKILKPLVKARIVASAFGPRGGFRLVRAASRVSLLEVLETVEGCWRGNGSDDEGQNPRLESAVAKAAAAARNVLARISIADLADVRERPSRARQPFHGKPECD